MTQKTGEAAVARDPATAAVELPPGKVAVPVARALEAAGELYVAGRLAQAERVIRQVIERRPNLPDAYNLLGVILNAKGDAAQAVKLVGIAIKMNPNIASYHSNLGEIERQRGNLAEAEAALNEALRLDANSAESLNNLGIVYFENEKYEEAADCYQKALALQPEFPEAHNNLGNAYRALERRTEAIACYQRAVTLREAYPEAYNNMATALRDQEDFESAEHAYRKAIMLKPGYIDAHNNLAMMLAHKDRSDEALRILGDALKIDEKHLTTLLNVAKVQLKRANFPTAEQAVRIALQQEPDKPEAYSLLAQIYHDLDRHQEALNFIEKSLELDPEAADARSFYGVVLKSLGRLDEARDQLRKALELNPELYGAYSNLNDLETFKADHELVVQMQDILAKAEKPRSERYLPIYYALAKAYEDAGEYEKALEHYGIGSRLRRAQLKYDEAETFAFFDSIKATFDRSTFEAPPWPGNPAVEPVFIVGMPRSGSTLVEQILSSHPQVYGAGEIKVLSHVLGQLRDRFPSIPKYPAMVAALEPSHFQRLADGYLAEVRRDAAGAVRITDKLLTNYFFVGLLRILFPNAKVIHTRRNPVDTCLSAYTKLFKDDMPHSYDLAELGRYYLRYADLMRHWEAVLPPGVLMTVDYEAVVDDLEGNARALIQHIGLPWDDACLSFHTSTRPVKTASVAQVRRPIYRTSVERWKRYGEGLAPLLEALGEAPLKPEPRRRREKA